MHFVKRLDIFSQNVRIKLNRERKHRTYFGVILSFGFLTAVIFTSLVKIQAFFDLTNPQNSNYTATMDMVKVDLFKIKNFDVRIRAFKVRSGAFYEFDFVPAVEIMRFAFIMYVNGPAFLPCEDDPLALCMAKSDIEKLKELTMDSSGEA